MTKDQAIEIAKRALRSMAKACKEMEYTSDEYKHALAELSDDQPTDDIPIGAPCEVSDADGDKQLQYYNGNGDTVIHNTAITGDGKYQAYDDVRPLTIWDIPKQYGGAPEWAIARAYSATTNYWLANDIVPMDEEDIQAYSRSRTSLLIERRPEKKEVT